MYIRTECGIIFKDEKKEIINVPKSHFREAHQITLYPIKTEFRDNIRITEKGTGIGSVGGHSYKCVKIKKQGENLIDVLEWEDIAFFKNGVSIKFDKEAKKLFGYKDVQEAIERYVEANEKITGIVTQEQYTQLAQEVK